MASVIHATAHGLVAGNTFRFGNVLPTNSGIDEATIYYVLAAGLTANDFTFSDALAGTPIVLDYAITDGLIRSGDSYEAEDSIEMPAMDPLDAPTGLTLTTDVTIDSDGHQIVRVKAAFTPGTFPGILGTKVELTAVAGPDWTKAQVLRAPLGTAFVQFTVPGNTTVYVRAASEDAYTRVSSYTGTQSTTSARDTTAPATPTGLNAADGVLGIGVTWTSNTEADLSYYELQVDDDVAFGSPTTIRLKGSLLTVTPLVAGTWYARVRAVDTSGNASAYTAGDSAISRLVATADLDATAIIHQATNLINGTVTITIDDTGLHIENGALFLKDAFGETVLVASGFSGAWADFIATGIYNGLLLAGTVGAIGLGRTVALPYWTVANAAGTPVLTFLSGGGVKATFAAINTTKTMTSDVIKGTPGEDLELGLIYDIVRVAGSLRLTVEVENNTKFDFSGFSSGGTNDSTSVTLSASGGNTLRVATSPLGGPFFRLKITFEEITAHNAGNSITVSRAWLRSRGTLLGQLEVINTLTAPGFVASDATSPTIIASENVGLTDGTALVLGQSVPGYLWNDGNDVYLDGDGSAGQFAGDLWLGFDRVNIYDQLNLGFDSSGGAPAAQGDIKWNDTSKNLSVHDSVRAKPVTPVGYLPYAYPIKNNVFDAWASAITLAVVSAGNAGGVEIPFRLDAPMLLSAYQIVNKDTASLRSAEFRLYYSKLQNSATATFVTGSDATLSFTPGGVASLRTAATSATVVLPPGSYTLVIRNTSAAQTFGIGASSGTTLSFGKAGYRTKSIAALGSTIDLITTWAGSSAVAGVMMFGKDVDGTTDYT